MFQLLFGQRRDLGPQTVHFDLHNHLLPGVDDGAPDADQALECVAALAALGYSGTVITPHIHPDAFDNDEDDLRRRFAEFAALVRTHSPAFRLQLGAEYFVDPSLLERIDRAPEKLLRFGPAGQFMLLEFPTMMLPIYAEDCLTACRRLGITPIIAHPERYSDIQADRDHVRVRSWRDHGALMQVNLGSLAGQYDSRSRAAARELAKAGLIDLLGSDLHRAGQAAHYIAPGWAAMARSRWPFTPEHHQRLFAPAVGA